MISIKINPSFYNTDENGSIIGWSDSSPFKKICKDHSKFVLSIGKSADTVIKTNYDITDDMGGSRSITVNHIGCEMNDSMFHSLVTNPNQYDYIVLLMDHMDRGHVVVYHDSSKLTTAQVAHFSI